MSKNMYQKRKERREAKSSNEEKANVINIQWFPGHMAKASRLIDENLGLTDIVIELRDARIPMSSRNPGFNKLLNNKKRIVVLTKADMADPQQTVKWTEYFKSIDQPCIFVNAQDKADAKKIEKLIMNEMSDKFEKLRLKGIKDPKVRTMIVGIPNVGKSTLINSFAGKNVAATGDKPGVTRGKQWIGLNNSLELLDTPGILWPKFDDKRVGERLAFTGAIKDDILDRSELALKFLSLLSERYPDNIKERYGVDINPAENYFIMLCDIGKSRGCLMRGGEVDYAKAAIILLQDFRNGRLGRITIDFPEDINGQSNKNN